MTSVFKKLIRREFGVNSYNVYFDYFHRNLDSQTIDNKEVFEDIYDQLKAQDEKTIMKMQERLNDTLLLAFRISKNYTLALIVYLFSVCFIIIRDMHPIVSTSAISLLSLGFVIKTYEFVINKYCYIDARIVLVYKSVLEMLIMKKRK